MLAISPLYVALGGVLVLVLAGRVIARRREQKIGLGDGGDREMLRRIRAHANAMETLPIALLMLVTLELAGGAALALHLLGGTLLLGRTLHAVGLSRKSGVSFGRFVGMLLTLLAIAGLAGALLWRAGSA